MNLLVGLILSIVANIPTLNVDCSPEDFLGTWEGKVVYNGDELAEGPYVISMADDGKGLQLKDEAGAVYALEVNGCDVVLKFEEEGMDMTTTYTFQDGNLAVVSIVAFPDADGNMQKMEMTGSMSKMD